MKVSQNSLKEQIKKQKIKKRQAQLYHKFYYLKKLLENPDYNKKRKQREKELKLLKSNIKDSKE